MGDLPHVGRTIHPQLNDLAAKDEISCEARRPLQVYRLPNTVHVATSRQVLVVALLLAVALNI
jgi:hypothetical protein